MKKLLLFLIIINGFIFAADHSTNDIKSNLIIKIIKIDKNSKLDAISLDSWWSNRESLTNQKTIADYLITKPEIPQDFEIAWKLSRLIYFIGNYGLGEQRFVKSEEGIDFFYYGAEAGKIALKIKPNTVEANYWYAIDLGSYGLAKGIISSAKNAPSGMNALKRAMQINPEYQWYGSSRILAKYYWELPFIFGGNKREALELLNQATIKASNFSNNWVFLGEYYLVREEYQKALTACTKAQSTIPIDGVFEEQRYQREAKKCILSAQKNLNND